MKVLITGGSGQLGRELQATVPPGWVPCIPDRGRLDITDRGKCEAVIAAETPDLVINAAAYTDVERHEDESAAAFRVNATGAENVAAVAAARGARVVHVSTDYVFDGRSPVPYRPTDAVHPLSVYGCSKAEGETRVLAATGGAAVVIRTAWLYSKSGRNFVNKMLRLSQQGKDIRVIADQVGTPTWARGLARAIWRFAACPEPRGLFHWSHAGVASWYDFAVAIQEEALALGLLHGPWCPMLPILTQDYPTRAARPLYSVLDKTECWQAIGETAMHWRMALREMLSDLRAAPSQPAVSATPA